MRKMLVHGLAFLELEDGSLFPQLVGGKGEAPAPAAPTPEERRLQSIQAKTAEEQLRIAKQQQAENEALTPVLLQEYGLSRTVHPTTGKITYEKTSDDLTGKRKEIEGMQLDRSLKALKGELPVTATLAKELELGERTLSEKLSRQLGPGWETSSAGIQAQAEYRRMATSLREAEQKDQLSTAETLSINRQTNRAGNTQGTYDMNSVGRTGASALFSNAGGSAGGALNYYGTLRSASEAARARRDENIGGYVSGGMGLAGAAVGVGGALLI